MTKSEATQEPSASLEQPVHASSSTAEEHIPQTHDQNAGALTQETLQPLEDDLTVRQLSISEHDDDLDSVAKILNREGTLTKSKAEQLLHLLLVEKSSHPDSSRLLERLLTQQPEALRALPRELQHNPKNVFRRCLASGTDGSKILADCLLSGQLWPGRETQLQCIHAILQLCIESLESSTTNDQVKLILSILVRLISTSTADSSLDLTPRSAEAFLSLLDLRRPQTIQSQALLVLMRILGKSEERETIILKDVLHQKGFSTSRTDVITAFSAAAALFPIVPALCKDLLAEKRVLEEVLSSLKKSAGIVSDDMNETLEVRQAALMLLSASCIDKTCRETINKKGAAQLSALLDDHDVRTATLSALIMVKSGLANTNTGISKRLANTALHNETNHVLAFEALAYISLEPETKTYITNNKPLLARIIEIIQSQDEALFSCMTILNNVSKFKVNQSKEQEKLAQLKAYAEAMKPRQDSSLESDAAVQARCQKLVSVGAVPAIILCCKGSQSLTIGNLAAQVLFALSRLTKERAQMVQQGAIGTLLRIREMASRVQHPGAAQATATTAAHAIARLLISVNPAHAFAGTVSAAAVVSALATLLVPVVEEGHRDWLPTFESLLALTNLASVDDDSILRTIISSTWTTMENDLLLSNNNMVRRACVELTCNLMQSPTTVAKFADNSESAGRRLHVLLALTDVDDIPTRRGAGGALAMLTGWDGVASQVLKQPNGLSLLLKLATDDNDNDSRHRGVVCIMNLINAPGEAGGLVRESLRSMGGKKILEDALVSTTDDEMKAITNDLAAQIS